ncbi:MAG: nucleoside-diphosphate sugar epimerase/dehydratase [Peptostreptococcus sp.]|uniref:UDP-glucose 4-epimerase n=2 Tax=Peptostreptococcaceae TaxID=186804 RepID=A0A379CEP1_9FIRM|nr:MULTISPECIES: nucleoside-diphosphate sugar epimerase/dehydratase [Peptostreptococcus]EKX94613.1 epimerase/dehydratase WbiI family protein [Peptostreptococcus anaerobius VPI 4330 = DSM 2949]MDU3422602.1 nucleoside-diphosphate sugar epimerase/dehydratase [Peptostreptococcus anaerobius]MDU3429485.1 nucleoside-diphosphate sugar epimerase/dehydratase [Peptostreptococcus sp.]MDU3454891.1 nucleoside-diphosphate sugar epimerase/dehydratase [Peptostreptococcus sp.]MDU5680669.1 nucleoside-diphosphate
MNSKLINVMIVGAGEAGQILVREIDNNRSKINRRVVVLVDDNKDIIGKDLLGIPVRGGVDEIKQIAGEFHVDEIIFSIANIKNSRKKEILDICRSTGLRTRTIPAMVDIIDCNVDIKTIRNVEIDDLLGREAVTLDIEKISGYLKDRSIMVTGGGGTIGSELCRQVANYNPKKLIILDNYENNAYSVEQELKIKYKNKLDIEVVIANIREEKRLDYVFEKYRPEILFHAAAHKHVPLMEFNKTEAVKNNIFGSLNLIKAADKYKVSRFVLISSDKAVNPTNIMGATKRAAEMMIQVYNEFSSTEFVAVRFGNVLGSSGSVVPLFKKQIASGGPVTVTHKDIIRYFMTIPEAVALVMQAGAMAKGGEIFVLDMGEPVKIDDLARNIIRLSGFEPDEDINIEYTGLRPGEKLFEELLMAEEGLKDTDHKKIFIGKPQTFNKDEIFVLIEKLREAAFNEREEEINPLMRKLVKTYVRPEDVNGL